VYYNIDNPHGSSLWLKWLNHFKSFPALMVIQISCTTSWRLVRYFWTFFETSSWTMSCRRNGKANLTDERPTQRRDVGWLCVSQDSHHLARSWPTCEVHQSCAVSVSASVSVSQPAYLYLYLACDLLGTSSL